MQIFAQTERLILREIMPSDDQGMFELDSDPEVHTYLGRKPFTHIEESRNIIEFIREQYRYNGIGRWAAVDKATGEFIGWAGLKLITEPINYKSNYYDLGYRFIRRYWGKGFATEAARASIEYGFITLHLREIYAMADIHNIASQQVLTKVGLHYIETFEHAGEQLHRYKISNPAVNA
jgi:RimJ/RimL family protein N-acetyltransferase